MELNVRESACRCIGQSLLIKLHDVNRVSAGGIVLPQTAEDNFRTGTVVEIGPKVENVGAGDLAVFSSIYMRDGPTGQPELSFKIGDVMYVVLPEDTLLLYVPRPPTYFVVMPRGETPHQVTFADSARHADLDTARGFAEADASQLQVTHHVWKHEDGEWSEIGSAQCGPDGDVGWVAS